MLIINIANYNTTHFFIPQTMTIKFMPYIHITRNIMMYGKKNEKLVWLGTSYFVILCSHGRVTGYMSRMYHHNTHQFNHGYMITYNISIRISDSVAHVIIYFGDSTKIIKLVIMM